MLLKIHKSYRNVVAICDSDLIGKKFEDGKFQLDVKESFYKGEEKPEEFILQVIRKMSAEDATFNIIGKESIQTAIKAGIINEDSVKEVQGVPFTLVLI